MNVSNLTAPVENIQQMYEDMIPEGLDYFNKVFNVITLVSAAIQIIYMISPRILQARFEALNHDFKKLGIFNSSFSGFFSGVFLTLMGVFYLQEYSYKTKEQLKMSEPTYETHFRHRNTWMIQSYFYQSQIIAIIWLSLNVHLKYSRRKNAMVSEI